MRARNEYQRIAESYNKVLSEGAPVGAAEHLRAGAAQGAKPASQGMLKPGQLPGGPNAAQRKAGVAIKQAYDGGPSAVVRFLNTPEGKDPKVRQFLHNCLF